MWSWTCESCEESAHNFLHPRSWENSRTLERLWMTSYFSDFCILVYVSLVHISSEAWAGQGMCWPMFCLVPQCHSKKEDLRESARLKKRGQRMGVFEKEPFEIHVFFCFPEARGIPMTYHMSCVANDPYAAPYSVSPFILKDATGNGPVIRPIIFNLFSYPGFCCTQLFSGRSRSRVLMVDHCWSWWILGPLPAESTLSLSHFCGVHRFHIGQTVGHACGMSLLKLFGSPV